MREKMKGTQLQKQNNKAGNSFKNDLIQYFQATLCHSNDSQSMIYRPLGVPRIFSGVHESKAIFIKGSRHCLAYSPCWHLYQYQLSIGQKQCLNLNKHCAASPKLYAVVFFPVRCTHAVKGRKKSQFHIRLILKK